jgi:enhancing lycopene biosynthesis protein 2
MTKVAMILSGCGHLDGAEIRESVLSLLFLDQQGADVDFYAPDILQRDVVDFRQGAPVGEQRNVLTEAARIARGNIRPLSELNMQKYDGLVIPGGFGVAKNLSDFALKGKDCAVLPEFQKVVVDAYEHKKPIAAICIAPAVLAAALKNVASPSVTIGGDEGVASAIESFGATHVECVTEDCVVDEANRIVTCSAYMREAPIADIADGIEKTIRKLVKWAENAADTKAA